MRRIRCITAGTAALSETGAEMPAGVCGRRIFPLPDPSVCGSGTACRTAGNRIRRLEPDVAVVAKLPHPTGGLRREMSDIPGEKRPAVSARFFQPAPGRSGGRQFPPPAPPLPFPSKTAVRGRVRLPMGGEPLSCPCPSVPYSGLFHEPLKIARP